MVQKPDIKLLYFPGCPNLEAARKSLAWALEAAGLGHANFTEINVLSPETPEKFKNYPSPSVLINGKDVEGKPMAGAAACRIYPGTRAPRQEQILEALNKFPEN